MSPSVSGGPSARPPEALPRVRFVVRHGCRGEIHEIDGREIVLGSDTEADLVLAHATVAPCHAKLLVRRGRLLLVDLRSPGSVTRIGAMRPRAPLVLSDGISFFLGEIEVQAAIATSCGSPVGTVISGFDVETELLTADPDVRRFRVRQAERVVGELALLELPRDRDRARAWYTRMEQSAATELPHLARALALGQMGDCPFVIEALSPGARLDDVVDAVARRRLSLPIEARLSIFAQVAEAIAAAHTAWGPHGALEPRAIQLGADGALILLRPGPAPEGFDDVRRRPFLAPERRCGGPPSVAADAWALAEIARRLVARGDRSAWPDGVDQLIGQLRARRAASRPVALGQVAAELRAGAHDAGLDPSSGHLARVARLLGVSGTPLARPKSRAPLEAIR